MARAGGGWWQLDCAQAAPGSRYRFQIDGGLLVPDPASRANPDDVHGASRVVDPLAFDWDDGDWRGRPWEEAVIYELHVGTFTPQGTFAGVQSKLDHLRELGVTAIELMPIADVPRAAQLGLRRGAAVRAGCELRHARGSQAPGAERPPPRADGVPRRGLQPLRAGRQLPARLRAAVLHRAPSHALGCGDQLRRRGQPHGARLLHPQRAVLAGGVSPRRPAPGRRARHRRRQPAAHPHRAGAGGARARRPQPPRAPGARERRQPDPLPGRAARGRRQLRRAVERRHPSRLARAADRRARRLLRRLRRRAARQPGPLPGRGLRLPGRALPATATASRAARRAAGCARARSCRSCRTTTRSATAPSASASAGSLRRSGSRPRSRSCCSRRSRRCCSWARNGPRASRSPSSATSSRIWRARSPKDGAASSPASTASATRPARLLIPDPSASTTFDSARLDWDARERPEHAEWLALYRKLLAAARARDRPAAARGRRGRLPRIGRRRCWPCAGSSATAPVCI